MEVLEIVQSSIQTTIQDAGRFGLRGYAIPQSGCLDYTSHYLANYLVGNSPKMPVIEIIGGGFVCKMLAPIGLGIVGASSSVMINGQTCLNQESIFVKNGDLVKIESPGITYLAIPGGVQGQTHFESVSTYPLANLGGLNGKVLEIGDRISCNGTFVSRELPEQVLPKWQSRQVIRVLKGAEWDRVINRDSDFEEIEWHIAPNSNRMGIRLMGATLKTEQLEMTSVPTFPGIIQLTNEGLPIVLINDAQTTGGYPRIGQVIKADLPRVSRLILGGTIKFKFVDISEARHILNKKEAFLQHVLD